MVGRIKPRDMFFNSRALTPNEQAYFQPLLNNGVSVNVVYFPDEKGDEHPVYVASYNGKPCHFPYQNTYTNQQAKMVNSDVWKYLNS